MEYDGELHLPKHYLVPPPHISRTTGEFLARNGVSTFACSESQKIGHVTFFWNGNRSGYFNEKLEMYKEVGVAQSPDNYIGKTCKVSISLRLGVQCHPFWA